MPRLLKQLRVFLLAAAGVWLLLLLWLLAIDVLGAGRVTPQPTDDGWQWSLVSHRRRSSVTVPDAIDEAATETAHATASQQLCILGTAWTREAVEDFMAEYGETPAMWTILTAPSNSTKPTTQAVETLSPALAIRPTLLSTPHSGLGLAAKDMSTHYSGLHCQYFAFCDATVQLRLLDADSSGWTAVTDTLLSLLRQHEPTVVTFPQPSDSCRTTAAAAADVWSGEQRAVGHPPLVVHESLMDFLFPLDWTGRRQYVGTEAATALLQRMYPHSTIAADAVFRTSRASIDCVEVSVANDSARVNDSSLSSASIIHHASKALANSLPTISTHTATVANSSSSPTNFLALLHDEFDILHPSIVHNPWVSSHHTLDSLRTFRASESKPRLTLLVFTLNRLPSLQRLLQSVVASDYSGWERVDLNLHVDYSDAQHTITRYLDGFTWPFGRMLRTYANVSLGLRDSILSAWQPETLDDFAVFLEDDIEVSTQFAVWVRVAVVHYYYSTERPLRESPLMGVSLYMPVWSERVDLPFWVDRTFPVYGMQAPSSWGAVYFPWQWSSFCRWQRAHAHLDPLVPGLAGINSWSMAKSWKKYLIRYMVEQGYYMLYPNRIDGLSFSTNHAEAGTNVYFSSEWKKVLDARFNVPLVPVVDHDRWYQRHSATLLGHIRVIDIFDQRVKLTEQQRIPAVTDAVWQAYSNLIIAVPLASASSASQAAVVAALQYWQDLSVLHELVVQVADTLSFSCPLLRVRCTVNRASVDSVDSYLWPLPHPRSASVLLLSPHIRLPLADVTDMFYLWQRHPDQLIGIASLTRSYRHVSDRYVVWTEALPQLTLLPGTAMLMASHYLDLYWSDERPFHNTVRQSVWGRGRGEDVAIQRLITNVTGRWPALVDRSVSGTHVELWHEPSQLYSEDLDVARNGYGGHWPWLNGRTLHLNETVWSGMYHSPDTVPDPA